MYTSQDEKYNKQSLDTTTISISVPNEISDVKSPPSRNLSVRILLLLVRLPPPVVSGIAQIANAFPGCRRASGQTKGACLKLGVLFYFFFYANISIPNIPMFVIYYMV